jgi:hypothetical protein
LTQSQPNNQIHRIQKAGVHLLAQFSPSANNSRSAHATNFPTQPSIPSLEKHFDLNLTEQSDEMAQKAKKGVAKANISTLNNLHLGTLGLNILFILFSLLIKRRSFLAYVLFSLPSLFCQFTLEKTGRPKFDANTKALKSSGEDLAAPGLTEYMFDVVWVTWASLIVVILFGNWGWLIWSVVPVYGAYKGYGLLGMARGMMGGGQPGEVPGEQPVAGNRKQRRAA